MMTFELHYKVLFFIQSEKSCIFCFLNSKKSQLLILILENFASLTFDIWHRNLVSLFNFYHLANLKFTLFFPDPIWLDWECNP